MAAVARSSWLCSSCQRRAFSSSRRLLHGSGVVSTRSYYSTTTSRDDKPLRMAIVGSGPAGFYTAYRVMSKIAKAKVDMYEALPVPFGLVRFGVAPDHPEVKHCQDKFEEVANSPNFTFIGNVAIGDPNPSQHAAPDAEAKGRCNIPLRSLLQSYDAVVLAYGAARDRTLGIPGESALRGIYSAREFVGWYNGHPAHAGLAPDLTRGDEAVVIGQGNVALDVARMLLEDVDVLRRTDIATGALEVLSESRVRRVHVVGRRGPMQAAFTIKEVREMMRLRDVGFHGVGGGARALIPDEISRLARPQRRLMEVIMKGSVSKVDEGTPRSWSLDFCLSPVGFVGSPDGHVSRTLFECTSLAAPHDPSSKVSGTGQVVDVASSVVFRSIGYKSVPLPGFEEAGVLFDERTGVVRNDGLGRALTMGAGEDELRPLRGVYCAGWVKRGPTGVIASTMEDAFITSDAIAADWSSNAPFLDSGDGTGWESVKRGLDESKCKVITWEDWHKIDKVEKEKGKLAGKEREKITSTADMISAAV